MGSKAISLMSGMLQMDPKKRYSALDALAHSYFDNYRDEEVEELVKQHKERHTLKQSETFVQPKKELSRSKDISRRNTSTDKHVIKSKKNPYSVAIGASPPQIVKKKYTNKMQKDRKSSNSIKNLLQGRSSSKDAGSKRNVGMGSYDNTAYSMPKNRRNMPGAEVLRENQSMSTYIPASFTGVYLQNMKNVQDSAEYDYEIGGEFGNKLNKNTGKLDNSMGLPSQIYGTDELKKSVSSSISGMLNKSKTLGENHTSEHRKIPSLSPSNRSEENKTHMKNYQSAILNKVVQSKKNKTRIKNIIENMSNDVTQLESINENSGMEKVDHHKNSYYEEEKSQRTLR